MKKNLIRIALVAVLLCTLIASAAMADMKNTYTVSDFYYVEEVGWYFTDNVQLHLMEDNKYELYYINYIFGVTDVGNKGNKTVMYAGTYSSVPSADGFPAHLDITLDTTERVYLEQHGKAFGRQELINFDMVVDTANWNDEYMTPVCFPAGSSDPAAEFLAAHDISGLTLTIEDTQLDISDVTLGNKILEMPDVTKLDIQ